MQKYLLSLTLLLLIASCSSDDEIVVVEIATPTSVEAFDIGNNNNSSDIRIFFNINDFSNIKEYQIFIVPSNSSAGFDINAASQVPVTAKQSVVTAANLIRRTLEAGITDTDGTPIVNDQEYNAFVMAIPDSESAESKLSSPSAAFSLSDKALRDLYISSRSTNSIELYDGVTGEHIKKFVATGAGGISAPQEVLFLLDGNLIVSARFNDHIKEFNGETGAFIGNFTSGYILDEPTKMNIGPDGFLYVSQWGQQQNSVVRFDTATGAFVDEIIASFFQGMDHAWDSDGNLYVVSFGLAEARKYDPDFVLLNQFNQQLTGPVNLWVADNNDLFIVDWSAGQVKIFDNQGNFKSVFITGLTNVEGHLFDGEGNLYLCDWSENLVNKYNAQTGVLISRFIIPGILEQPNSITFGPNHDPLNTN